jgi:plasmid stability protein
MTIVLDDDGLYAALKLEAARVGRPMKEIVAEAVREWLETQEDKELSVGLDEAIEEWKREGGIEVNECFRQLEAEREAKRQEGEQHR